MVLDAAFVQVFQALAREIKGAHRVLVDVKDAKLVAQFSRHYCLCNGFWQNNVFMIGNHAVFCGLIPNQYGDRCAVARSAGCDTCDDWYHETCVGLNVQQAKKIKSYTCPRCCLAKNIPYPFGPTLLEDPSLIHRIQPAAPDSASPAEPDSARSKPGKIRFLARGVV